MLCRRFFYRLPSWLCAVVSALLWIAWPVHAAPPHQGQSSAASLSQKAAHELSDAFAALAQRVSRVVVAIAIDTDGRSALALPSPAVRGEETPRALKFVGSGVVFRADGLVLTNRHVVDHARVIEVTLSDGRTLHAKLVGADDLVDLALLRVDATGLQPAALCTAPCGRLGEWVLAVGGASGTGNTVTAGVLGALGRGLGLPELEDYLQTDAHIHRGNTGGALVDLQGQVLGINTWVAGDSGVSLAIPAHLARDVAEQLATRGHVRRAWAGMSLQDLTSELAMGLGVAAGRGALIASVTKAGPAERAGLHTGDVIELVDGAVVQRSKDVMHAVVTKQIGSPLRLRVRREAQAQDIELQTAERPDSPHGDAAVSDMAEVRSAAELGLRLAQLTEQTALELQYTGAGKVVVVGVQPGSAAAKGGIERGDVIVEAGRRPIEQPEDVLQAVQSGAVVLRIERKTGAFFTVVSLTP